MLEERIADTKDIHFIAACISYGARKGHYHIDVENPVIINCMKKEVHAVVTEQKLLDNRQALATVYTLGNKRVAMAIISEAFPADSSCEIYAMSVAKGFQGKGYGSQIMDIILDRYFYQDVYARCFPASERMQQILVQRGFEFKSKDNGCMILMKSAAHYCENDKPLYMSY